MSQSGFNLFDVKLNEEGARYLRGFASISYIILVLVYITCGITIYWGIRFLLRAAHSDFPTYTVVSNWVYMVNSVLVIISNTYFARFPHLLLRAIRANDETGANRAFRLLLKSAALFLVYAFISLTIAVAGLIYNSFI